MGQLRAAQIQRPVAQAEAEISLRAVCWKNAVLVESDKPLSKVHCCHIESHLPSAQSEQDSNYSKAGQGSKIPQGPKMSMLLLIPLLIYVFIDQEQLNFNKTGTINEHTSIIFIVMSYQFLKY